MNPNTESRPITKLFDGNNDATTNCICNTKSEERSVLKLYSTIFMYRIKENLLNVYKTCISFQLIESIFFVNSRYVDHMTNFFVL